MTLVLLINGKKADEQKMCLQSQNIFTDKCLLFNSVESIKLRNKDKMIGEDWGIFIHYKSKLNETISKIRKNEKRKINGVGISFQRSKKP